jgi:large subunit ribosomal protein L3
MTKFILGKKIGMTQMYQNDKMIPVTLLEAGPVVVVQVKNKEKDGYEAVQVGYGEKKEKNLTKAVKNHMKGLGNFRWLKEFKFDKSGGKDFQLGEKIDTSIFTEGDIVKISGFNKSKGYQGVVKRHGFHGGPKTHGQKNRHRAPGSIGATHPQHVPKGRRMAGRMGHERITIKNCKIAQIDAANNIIALKGAVPGKRGDLIEIVGK